MLVKEGERKPTHVLVETEDHKKYNFAFQRVEVLSGNVGLMKFYKFYQDEKASGFLLPLAPANITNFPKVN